MKKEQRLRYEMFVRVRDFGAANTVPFPAGSRGGVLFNQVKEVVADFEDHLTKRDLARAEAQRVKATTRRAVLKRMQTIAAAARRVAVVEPGANPFRMPARKSAAVVLARARLFIEEVGKRHDQFERVGLTPPLISEFETLVNVLEAAVTVQLNSRARRGNAQAGLVAALKRGFVVIRDLDVVVAIALRNDPVRLAGWQAARHIEGPFQPLSGRQKPDGSSAPTSQPPDPSAAPPLDATTTTPLMEKAS